MSEFITCLLCEVSSPSELVSATVRDIPNGSVKAVRCLSCGHVQLHPLPSETEDEAFYASDQQTRRLMGDINFPLWKSKSAADTDRRIDWLCSLAQPSEGEVLDIGCGYGFYVDALVKAGFQATGMDVSRERLDLARKHMKGDFIQGKLSDDFLAKYRNRFSVVTLFHVLEHVRTPAQFLRSCASLVAPGGRLLVEVPNLGDRLLSSSANYRAFYWQQAHLSYFDAARLDLVMRRAAFTNFSVRGIQRYGLRNLLHWLDEGKPQLETPSFQEAEPLLMRLEGFYRDDREVSMTCDTLICEVQK